MVDVAMLMQDIAATENASEQTRGVHNLIKPPSQMNENYQFMEEIGAGNYGVVSKARKKGCKYDLACKHIDKRLAGTKGLSEVMNEVETLALLNHPNIVKLEEVFGNNESLWIVMHFVTGVEMLSAQKQRGGRFPEPMVRKIAFQLLLAIDHLHSKGLVHRDLKPANCLLHINEESDTIDLKLVDFGFAASTGDVNCLTQTCGTPLFMAPEMCRGDAYGKPIDMWSFGVILYSLFSGTYPFQGSSQDRVFQSVCEGRVRFDGPVWETISAGAKDLILKLLEQDVNRRLTAKDALKHYWLRANMTPFFLRMYGIDDDDDDDDNGDSSRLNSGDGTQHGGGGLSRRRLRMIFRAAVAVVMAAHRLIFAVRTLSLQREGMDYPILKSFSYLVSGHFSPASQAINARAMCPGNAKILYQLTNMLERSDNLETFDVSMNMIDSSDLVQRIVGVCVNHPTLTSLNLEGNPLPALAVRSLQRLARQGNRIRVININNTNLGADTIASIGQLLRENDRKRSEQSGSQAASRPRLGVSTSYSQQQGSRPGTVTPPQSSLSNSAQHPPPRQTLRTPGSLGTGTIRRR